MNIVRELRTKRGIQQKELALELGISSAAVSNWEKGKSDPSGDRLRRLAEFFDVDEGCILGYGTDGHTQPAFIPEDPRACGVSETEQIVQHVLERLSDLQPKTEEARIMVQGIDRLPEEKRKQALNVVRAMFSEYASYFDGEAQDES